MAGARLQYPRRIFHHDMYTRQVQNFISYRRGQHAAVSRFVSTFKRFCNKEYGVNLWQRGFHDHVIRDRRDLEEHLAYISENPLKWQLDPLYA